ncbi:MAG: polyhydroxyalkanoate synthesis regulator DNA-binding domain-containing protein [Pseudomonadota bacterium]
MLNIKKYTDGRFFDTVNKKFLKPEQMAELIKKGEAISVVLTKTGKDITDSVLSEFVKKTGSGKDKKEKTKDKKDKKQDHPFLKTDGLKKWVGDAIDKRIGKILDAINLPTKDQVKKLDDSIRELNKKIEALEALKAGEAGVAGEAPKKPAAKPRKKTVKKAAALEKETPAKPEDKTPETGEGSAQA